jgi:ergothioneine biosynthesis protein EgtB
MSPIKTGLSEKYIQKRKQTENLCEPLEAEDLVVQPISDVSPPKWHLAHTTWFFENFILKRFVPGYKMFHPRYNYLFNSYYLSAGERLLRQNRGYMTRPTGHEIINYREYVDQAMQKLLEQNNEEALETLVELGLHHEQQHQELLLYDIKYILGNNPLFPQYLPLKDTPSQVFHENKFLHINEGLYDVGFSGEGFHFDNEEKRHKVYLHSFSIMDRLVTNEEYAAFIEDGGYEDFRLWFMDAHEWIRDNNISAPLYWHKIDGIWHRYALRGGFKPIDPKAPVSHVSMYEADAFAKWSGKRLPTEFEWEIAAGKYGQPDKGNYAENQLYEPSAVSDQNNQLFGDVWEWTNSSYLPYPGYKIPEGAIGEYNGKFMINQMVLRGGSCATPADHIRTTYRNFFYPNLRWLFSGIRLAESL